MKFISPGLSGVYVIELEPVVDHRGFFSRSFCREQLLRHGCDPQVAQSNVSYSKTAGTLRGLHGSLPHHSETKLIRCTAGAVWDVVVDGRPDSETFGRWIGVELTAANKRAVYVPHGCLHGFLTLTDDAEVLYLVSQPYDPAAAWGARWDDDELAIAWPSPPRVLSAADENQPSFRQAVERAFA